MKINNQLAAQIRAAFLDAGGGDAVDDFWVAAKTRNAWHKDRRRIVVTTFYLGVPWQGASLLTLKPEGTLAKDPAFQSQLEIERSDLEDDFDALKANRVVSLGFNFRF